MKVKIVKCFEKDWWHQEYIGETVEVIGWWSKDAYFVPNISEHGAIIPKGDCVMEKKCKNCLWHYFSINGDCTDLDNVVCSIKNQKISQNDSCERFVEEEK